MDKQTNQRSESMKPEYIEKIYAGWLAKIIGIRLGAPIEGWTYEQIKEKYGELHYYPVDYKRFAADDDSNGPIFFIRALEECRNGINLTAADIGDTVLNCVPYERSFFWWGGYGISTEHTAYLNLRAGVKAPNSGSAELNGLAVAEQIGGQIFIDSWGLVCPANPDLAAKYAEMAASVTHDGNGIYGGVFIATCIAHAFQENNMHAIIEKGLSYIPHDCEYTRVVRAVMAYHATNPSNWRDCYKYIFDNFGYDRYPGGCHIIPNTAVMILALLYGEGKFDDTLNICNMCGWDTDCNVGNIATIMGVVCGLEGIDDKWRKPINDFLACSGVMGSRNIMDIPYSALYMAKLAYAIVGEKLPEPWFTIVSNYIEGCHFEFPGSTHGIELRKAKGDINYNIINSEEQAATGSRSLKISVEADVNEEIFIYKRTYLYPSDFDDSRYDPCFSPILYPGQTIKGRLYLPSLAGDCTAQLYAKNATTGEIFASEKINPSHDTWVKLSYKIPGIENGLIDEAGFIITSLYDGEIVCFIDDLYFEGQADYTIDFSKPDFDNWAGHHKSIKQFSKVKGLTAYEDNMLSISCADFAEIFTGHHDWADYVVTAKLVPQAGHDHYVNVRVQGAMRSYAIGLCDGGKICVIKNEYGSHVIAQADFSWEMGKTYELMVNVNGPAIDVYVNGAKVLQCMDNDNPHLTGAVGLSVKNGSRTSYKTLAVTPN